MPKKMCYSYTNIVISFCKYYLFTYLGAKLGISIDGFEALLSAENNLILVSLSLKICPVYIEFSQKWGVRDIWKLMGLTEPRTHANYAPVPDTYS